MEGSYLAGLLGLGVGDLSIANEGGDCRCAKPSRGSALGLDLIGLSIYGRYYWTTGRFLVSTYDATVAADSAIISPKASGHLSEVLVDDNQVVHAYETLARIRPSRLSHCARWSAGQRRFRPGRYRQPRTEDRPAAALHRGGAGSRYHRSGASAFAEQDGRYSGLARTAPPLCRSRTNGKPINAKRRQRCHAIQRQSASPRSRSDAPVPKPPRPTRHLHSSSRS